MVQDAKNWGRVIAGVVFSVFLGAFSAEADGLMQLTSRGEAPIFGAEEAPTVGAALLCSETPGDAFCRGVEAYTPLRLNAPTVKVLEDINLAVNWEVEPVDDIVLWNVPERWSRPVPGPDGHLQDDCDGYVIEKWYRLVTELGLPKESFYPLYADVPGYGGHLVLAVVTDRGTYILDNLTDDIVPLEKFSFTFLKRPRPGDRLDGAWERFLALG